jgi:hypothetical protein
LGNRVIAIVATLPVMFGCGPRMATAGFWYDDDSFALPAHAAEKLGGPLTDAERESIEHTSRLELERAFAGMRINITGRHDAFWRVEVVRALRGRSPLPNAGESMPRGFLGGSGGVSFELIALKAIQYAPPGATRQTIVDGIGRGIGRVAAHELAHQMINAGETHNPGDENSYEFPSPDRPAQYYGELRWTTARPLLEQRLR